MQPATRLLAALHQEALQLVDTATHHYQQPHKPAGFHDPIEKDINITLQTMHPPCKLFTQAASTVICFFLVVEIFSDRTCCPKICYTYITPVQNFSPLKFY